MGCAERFPRAGAWHPQMRKEMDGFLNLKTVAYLKLDPQHRMDQSIVLFGSFLSWVPQATQNVDLDFEGPEV